MVLQVPEKDENFRRKPLDLHLPPEEGSASPNPPLILNHRLSEQCYELSHGNVDVNISKQIEDEGHNENGSDIEIGSASQNLELMLRDASKKEIGQILIGPIPDELAASLLDKILTFGEGEEDPVTGGERVLLASSELREILEELADNEIPIRSGMGNTIDDVVSHYADRVYGLSSEVSPAVSVACRVTLERVLAFDPNGDIKLSDGFKVNESIPESGMVWIDVESPNEDTIKKLKDRFGFSSVDLADCLEFDQRTKLRDHGKYLFIVTHAFSGNGGPITQFKTDEIHAFLGKNFLVTIHSDPVKPLSDIYENISQLQISPEDRSPDYLYFLLSESLMGMNTPFSNKVRTGIESIYRKTHEEKMAFEGFQISPADLTLMLMSMRGLISDQMSMFSLLSDKDHPLIGAERKRLFRNLVTESRQIVESVQDDLSLVDRAVNISHAQATTQLGWQNNMFAVLGAIVTPWMVTSSFFGQNFAGIPFGSDALLFTQIGTSVAGSALLFWLGMKIGLIKTSLISKGFRSKL